MFIHQPGSVEGTSQFDSKTLWVGDIIEISYQVSINHGIGVLVLNQPLPSEFELVDGKNILAFWKKPGKQTLIFTYKVRCPKRGKYLLNPVKWEARHLLGLVQTKTGEIFNTEIELIVKPKILSIRKVRSIKAFSSSPLPVIDIAKIGVATTDFREIRNYVVGDPVKSINWKATARRSSRGIFSPLTNEYEVEGKKAVWLFLDSASYMNIGDSMENCFEYSLEAANRVARYHLDLGYRVGMYIYNNSEKLFYPDTGTRQFYKISRYLLEITTSPEGDNLSSAIDRCRSYILGYNPLCFIITRLDVSSTDKLIEGAKKLAVFRGRLKRRLPLVIISIGGYTMLPQRNSYERNASELIQIETRPDVKKLRALGATVIEWNPKRVNFTTALVRQLLIHR